MSLQPNYLFKINLNLINRLQELASCMKPTDFRSIIKQLFYLPYFYCSSPQYTPLHSYVGPKLQTHAAKRSSLTVGRQEGMAHIADVR